MSVNAIMRVILFVVVKSCICMCWCKVVNFCVFESFYLIDIVHFVVYPSVLSQHIILRTKYVSIRVFHRHTITHKHAEANTTTHVKIYFNMCIYVREYKLSKIKNAIKSRFLTNKRNKC